MNPDYRPRLSVDLTEEQAEKLRQMIPHGLQGKVMRLIIDDLIYLMETKGIHTILSAFLDRIITLEAVSFVKGIRDGNDK